jgi:hypothetical protein
MIKITKLMGMKVCDAILHNVSMHTCPTYIIHRCDLITEDKILVLWRIILLFISPHLHILSVFCQFQLILLEQCFLWINQNE